MALTGTRRSYVEPEYFSHPSLELNFYFPPQQMPNQDCVGEFCLVLVEFE